MVKSVDDISAFFIAFIEQFGIESVYWNTETVFHTLLDEWEYVPNDVERSKIFAGLTVLSDDKYMYDPDVFEKVVIGLSGNYVDFRVTQQPDVDELFIGVKNIQELRPSQFGYQINAYMGTACYAEDLLVLPKTIFGKYIDVDAVQDVINKLMEEPQPVLVEDVNGIFDEGVQNQIDTENHTNPIAYQVHLLLTLSEGLK